VLASNWPSFGALLSVTEKGLETGMEEDWVPTPAKELTCLGTPSERSGGYGKL
jgi:hypothetical protein